MTRSLFLSTLLLAAGCKGSVPPGSDGGLPPDERARCAERTPERRALFGDLHVHTALSFDAYTYDVRTTPELAYRFARGEAIRLPPLDGAGLPTVPVRLARPLDFAAVTDHAEYLGETSLCTTPGSAAYDSDTCKAYRGPRRDYLGFGVGVPGILRADLCGSDGHLCTDEANAIWRGVQDAAEAAYDRSAACRFTSFVGYEYTLSPFGSNLHRNVLFRNRRVPPAPTSQYEAETPQDLWRRLKADCLDKDKGQGCDVLAIPHNSNLSNGRMFAIEYPDAKNSDEERAQATLRAGLEPLIEISQHKGDSECANGLPGAFGAPDELCDYEKLQRAPFLACGPTGKGSDLLTWEELGRPDGLEDQAQ